MTRLRSSRSAGQARPPANGADGGNWAAHAVRTAQHAAGKVRHPVEGWHWCTDGVLGLLAGYEGDVSVAAVAAARQLTRHRAQKCLDVLRRRGFAERVATGMYAITPLGREAWAEGRSIRPGPCAPHTGPRKVARDSLQARVWKALRQAKKATAAELVMLAGGGGSTAAVHNARGYLKALSRAGYVAVLAAREPGTAPTSTGFHRYILARDPGPLPPVWNKRTNRLRDPNSGAVVELAPPKSEGPR